MSDDKVEEIVEEQAEKELSVGPLEVKVVEDKKEEIEEDLDYIDYDISDDEIKESGF